jgi:hypothetical protein
MECSCTINVDHDGGPSFHNENIQTARKKHRCYECLKDILPGEKYEYVSGVWDGDFMVYKTCLDCKSIRDTFFDSWFYTQVWENFQDEFGYHDSVVPESCIAELTPGARDRVCEYIENSWED